MVIKVNSDNVVLSMEAPAPLSITTTLGSEPTAHADQLATEAIKQFRNGSR